MAIELIEANPRAGEKYDADEVLREKLARAAEAADQRLRVVR